MTLKITLRGRWPNGYGDSLGTVCSNFTRDHDHDSSYDTSTGLFQLRDLLHNRAKIENLFT